MIKEIRIVNFKNINCLEIYPSEKFNVIIGENNIGKTTIFEAIHLWKMCYDKNIKRDKMGFYATAKNMKFEDMEFIRVYHDEDLFPVGCNGKDAKLKISISISYKTINYNLGFTISKVSNIDDAYLQVEYIEPEEFKKFSNMVNTIQNKTVATFIAINESKPIPNIIAKEPYMYKAQILNKIAKGKNNEVLRNKVIGHIAEVQKHINNIMDSNYVFMEHDRDKKTYITITVDGKNIFSYGSGFLQLTEIFASMEYLEPEINILLIDEPDAHLHLKLQKKLINEFREIHNSQMFIITHNERFLEEVKESEILFVNDEIKNDGILKSLPTGAKNVALENLKGCIGQIEKFQFASKIIAVEGQSDRSFIDSIKDIYERLTEKSKPGNVYIVMCGIDTLNAKLITYSRALKDIIPSTCKWLIIRDTDCVPRSKKTKAGNNDKKDMDAANVKVIFQDGYGIESTFASDPLKLSRLLCAYYNFPEAEKNKINLIINDVNIDFINRAKDITNVEVNQELNRHFTRQKEKRSGRVYDSLCFCDMLEEIDENNVQYILTKKIMDMYLVEIHRRIQSSIGTSKNELDKDNIFTFYYSWINSLDDIFDCHKKILEEIYDE